jgi:GxxExxY protein
MASATVQSLTANQVSHAIITAAMKVYTELGLGLLESTYQACLQHELADMGYRADAQVSLPVVYYGTKLNVGYRIDLLVEDLVVVELKSIDAIAPIRQAQILSYLKLSGKSIGLLINFNVVHLRDCIKRLVNGTNWQSSLRDPSCPLW